MKTIWKFALEDEFTDVVMPIAAKILSVGLQHGVLMMWALVTPGETEVRRFRVCPTGQEIEPGVLGEFLGTFFVDDGTFVFHVFELK